MKRLFLNEFNVKITMLIMTILYCIPFLMECVDNLINIVIIWAAIIIAWDLVNRRTVLKTHSALIGVSFVFCFFVTTFFNPFASVNLKLLVYIFLQMLFFTYFDQQKTNREIVSELKKLSILVIRISFLINIISLVMFFAGYCEIFTNHVISNELLMGRHPNSSLYGIMANANWTSFLELTNIGLLCFWGRMDGKMNIKTICLILLCSSILFLTNSRGGLIGLLIFIIVDKGINFLRFLLKNRKKAGICFLMLPILFSITIGGNKIVKDVSGNIYKHIKTVSFIQGPINRTVPIGTTNNNVGPSTSIQRNKKEKEGSNNIRVELWRAGIKVMQENFLMGIGGEKIGVYIFEKLSDNSKVDSLALASNTHNILIQTGVTAGIFGMLFFMTFILRELLYSLLYLFRYHGDERIKGAITVLFSLLTSYLVINLVEADIFMSRNFMSCLFWILLGYMTKLTQAVAKKEM